jgi:hypothetical protein
MAKDLPRFPSAATSTGAPIRHARPTLVADLVDDGRWCRRRRAGVTSSWCRVGPRAPKVVEGVVVTVRPMIWARSSATGSFDYQ